MTTFDSWTSTGVRPRVHPSGGNVWEGEFGTGGMWRRTFDKLEAWFRDPSVTRDDDIEPPTREIIDLVAGVASHNQRCGAPAPTRMMPNGEGGIVLEWVKGDDVFTWEFESDGCLEVTHYSGGRRVSRVTHDLVGLSPHA